MPGKTLPSLIVPFGNGVSMDGLVPRDRLGGKGAGLIEMTRAGLPVPPGFVIPTDVCRAFQADHALPADLTAAVRQAVSELETQTGKRFGDAANPLLLAVRSGAAVSMPGMMETVLNVGLNDAVAAALAADDARFAYDSYRRLISMFATAVHGVPRDGFDALMRAARVAAGVDDERELDGNALRTVAEQSLELFEKLTKQPFPQEPADQLLAAIAAVFGSWDSPRANEYRRIKNIDAELGTAVVVQAMVFGNADIESCTGVGFTRDPSTGKKEFFGEFVIQAQGEDLVAGTHTPLNCRKWFAEWSETLWAELNALARTLETHYRDMQDFEFTVERGTLYLLQTRSGQRTSAAAVKIAVDLVGDGLIDQTEAVSRVDAEAIARQLPPVPDKKTTPRHLTRGLPASPGVATGRLAFDAEDAAARAAAGEAVILVRPETFPEDIAGFDAAAGVLTSTGGMTSHAAVVARGLNRPCVVGARRLAIDEAERRLVIKAAGKIHTFGPADTLSIDGGTGAIYAGEIKVVAAKPGGPLKTLLRWTRAKAAKPSDTNFPRR